MSRSVAIGNCVGACQTWNPGTAAPDQAFRYIDLSSVDRELKRITGAETILCSGAPSRARQLVKAGDVLVSTVRPNLNGVAIVPAELDGATASTGFTVLRALKDQIDPSYLFHWVKNPLFIDDMVRKATGASYPAVSDRVVRESLIPLPEIAEQRRIAAILDKADALRNKRRDAIAKLDQLLQSVFLDMFGDTARWPHLAIGEICAVKGGKRLPKGAGDASSPTPFRYIRVSDIEPGRVLEHQLKYLTPEVQAHIKRYTVSAGDVVIAIAGTIGVVAPIGRSLSGANLTENAAKLVALGEETYEAEYLAFALGAPEAQSQIKAQTGQVTIGKLALFRIEKVSVPMPPRRLQQKFVELKRAIERQAVQHVASLALLDAAIAGLQQQCFQERSN